MIVNLWRQIEGGKPDTIFVTRAEKAPKMKGEANGTGM